ncbi:hypothetical protein [Halomicrobium sp. LC1Hm]|uniref:hypothetical protein n=1 Tax=Halomicrobium sp. LC1Hm TaxID=2610902 RepID=UPI0012983201|nr:hypothetical protein [Halomicrobium sp. LC1Hm]
MELVSILKRWKEAVSLLALCIVWVILGVSNGGLSIPDTLYEVSLLVMLLLTVGMLIHEVRQSASA